VPSSFAMEDDMKSGGAMSFAEYPTTAPELAAALEERGQDSHRARAFSMPLLHKMLFPPRRKAVQTNREARRLH
jgi:hypothetical protein